MELDLHGLFKENGTIDYVDYEYKEECNTESSSRFMVIFITILYSVVLLLGLLGNGMVLAALFQKKRSLNVTSVFVLHLSLADLILLLTIPLRMADAVNRWSLNNTTVCKLAGAVFTINFCCCIFLLVCMSLDHYLSLVHSQKIFSSKKLSYLQLICVGAWFVSFLISIPDWIYLKSTINSRGDRTECLHNYLSVSARLTSRYIYHIVGFLLPAIVLLYCWSRVLLLLFRGSKTVQSQNGFRKPGGTYVTFIVVLAFLVCWLPYNIALLVNTVKPVSIDACREHQWTAVKITALFGFLHTFFNPLIYASVSGEFSRWVLVVMKCGGCAVGGDLFPWDAKVIEDASVSQEEMKSLQMQPDSNQQKNESHEGT